MLLAGVSDQTGRFLNVLELMLVASRLLWVCNQDGQSMEVCHIIFLLRISVLEVSWNVSLGINISWL